MAQLVGRSIGRYHIVEQLGEGGMAQVYKAYDNRLERYVAVKVILPSQEQSEMFLKRFEREAKSLAQLTHSNIVRVLDYGDEDGMPYLIMEYISGGTLKQKLGKAMPFAEAARLLVPIAEALQCAHQRGIYHRDVKPANILLNQSGQPLLSDFGIAKVLESTDQATLTGTGVGIGTPEYMSPEQGLGQAVDQRSDVYSLGVVFYELVSGRRPFRADTPMAVIFKQISEPLPRPRDFAPDLPEAVEAVIFKAMAKKPDERYQDMEAFAQALRRLAQNDLPGAAAEATLVSPSAAATMVAPGATVAAPGPTRRGAQAAPSQPAPGPMPSQPAKKRSVLPWILIGGALVTVLVVVVIVGLIVTKFGKQGAALLAAGSTRTPAAETTNSFLTTDAPNAESTAVLQATQTGLQPGDQFQIPVATLIGLQPGDQFPSPTALQSGGPPQTAGGDAVIQGDRYSVKSITSALTGLSSFRLTFEGTTAGKDASGNPVTVQTSLAEEYDQAKKIRHLRATKTGGDSDEDYNFYIVDQTTFVYAEADKTCQSAGVGQGALIAATVPLPGEIVGVVEGATLGGKGETANDIPADRYAFDHTNLPTAGLTAAKGDLWAANEGGYVVKLKASGTGPNGNVSWEYNLMDVNQPVDVSLPEACSSPQGGGLDIPLPANATDVSNLSGMVTFKSPDSPSVVANFFKLAMPQKGWKVEFQTGSDAMTVLILSKDSETLQIMIQADTKGGSAVTVNQQG